MRILVISDLPQFVLGGAETQAALLIGSWLRAGHSVRCFGRRIHGNEVSISGLRFPAARIRTITSFGRGLRGLSYFGSLCALLVRHKKMTDVVVCQFLNEAAATAALLKKLRILKAPVVAIPASVGGLGDAHHLRSVPAWRRLVRLLDRHVDEINLIAPAMREELCALGFSGNNFQQIPNGVTVRPLADPALRQRQWVFVGRLAEEKALDLLIDAFARIPLPKDPPTIVFAGDGPERQMLLERATGTAWKQQFRFVGRIGEAEVGALLDRSELFLLPSRFEGMTNAGLEAMERGLPVLLSACGGLDRYVTPIHGWVVTPNDRDSLTDALDEALRTPRDRLLTMGAACRRLVEEHFDAERVARRYLDRFALLVERNSR